MNERDYLVETLCRQILGGPHPDGQHPTPTRGIESVAGASVRIDLQGIVRNMTRQVYLDSAAINRAITEEIERQAAEVSLDDEIAKAVRAHVENALARLDSTVEKMVNERVQDALSKVLKSFPEDLARQLAARVWATAWDAQFGAGVKDARKL
jgi:hypothetical protein